MSTLEHYALHKNLKATARMFGIPRSTLKDRLLGKVSMDARVGHQIVLIAAEEANTEETCRLFAEWGFGIGR